MMEFSSEDLCPIEGRARGRGDSGLTSRSALGVLSGVSSTLRLDLRALICNDSWVARLGGVDSRLDQLRFLSESNPGMRDLYWLGSKRM